MLLQIKKENAIKMWQTGDRTTKNFLEGLFGADVFEPKSIMDRVKTFDDALEVLGIDVPELAVYRDHYNEIERSAVAAYRLMIIIKALNEGWMPNWLDSDQRKWYPWFNNPTEPSGGFSFDGCDFGFSYTGVGSRLVFKSRELAEYAGKQFIDEYNEYLSL